ncbi:hypothetical protein [Paenibacillus xylanexedens]|uniref:hypothetical protein n=1 Tax=Paenibacillus xylanexedens TaxID=528191 RepID=UPI000B24F383|nr:hypothetical protein [Paenibacillus xylanexedens]
MRLLRLSKLLLVCCLCLLLIPTSAFASAENKTVKLDITLLKQGIPYEVIESWSPEFKKSLSKEDGSIEVVAHEKASAPEFNGEVGPLGNIKDDQFDYYITIVRTDNVNNRERFMVALTGKWKSMPFWRLSDAYGASFDKEIWRTVPGSGYYEDKVKYSGNSTFTTLGSGRNFSYTGENGVGFNADLKGGIIITEQVASAVFTIEHKKQGNQSGLSQIQSNYYHIKGTGSVGLSFGALEVSFSGSADNDSRGTLKNFNY